MALTEIKQGTVICEEGKPLKHLLFITKGSAEAFTDDHTFRYEKGDVIGICELNTGSYSHTYTALSDTTVFTYPFTDFDSLEALIKNSADTAALLVNSMCRIISAMLKYKFELKEESDSVFDAAKNWYPEYEKLSELYAFTPKKLIGVLDVKPSVNYDPLKKWVHRYYTDILDLDTAVRKDFFINNPGISLGFLHKGAEDFAYLLQACKDYYKYIQKTATILFSSNNQDLFTLLAELHFDSINIKGADAAVETMMTRLTGLLSVLPGFDNTYYQKRVQSYQETLKEKRSSQVLTDTPSASGVKLNLSDSLNVILDYGEYPSDSSNKFIRDIREYISITDKGSTDDDTRRLRKDLTAGFYRIYQQVFLKYLNDPAPPTIIKMFLNFGYMDATLAGTENADYLYSIADSLKGDPASGVYTIPEWLTAIYNGKKEPSRNEFDEDYFAFIHEMRMTRQIDDAEEARLLADNEGKLRFEIENVFPSVNKITYGVISTFCPIFSDYGVQRKLETSLVTPALLKEKFDEIRSIDFSAFYREATYTNPAIGITSEAINVEVLPEVILTPNVGIRGVMWQEIEGRKRTTPARIFMSIFFQTDLKVLILRLTSEFRWEMCKRVQGPRWNDITDLSLTSEYSDYLQFYKSNRDLSTEVKEAVKLELTRARNTFRTVFSNNYLDWMQYESNGTPRLNKHARKILMMYCPFPAVTREKVSTNPQFAEPLKRFSLKQQQRVKQITLAMQRLSQKGVNPPQELLDELEYANK